MQFKIKGKIVFDYSVRRFVYAICFLLFCVIEQRSKTCSGLDGWSESFRDLTGVVMAVMIMSHYRWKEFKERKLPYLTWTAISIVGGVAAFFWGRGNRPFLNDWIVIIVDVILFGYIVIHTFISVVMEKRFPKLNRPFAIVWLAMMLLMLGSRSDYIWPLCYLVMFGCFYLTDFTKEEQKDLFQGMLDGIILGFFVLQGLCFVFRPYDEVRYKGFFSNPNWNALFYIEVLAAVFAKLVYVTKKQCSKWVRCYYWIGAGVVLSFELLTIGRSGWITAVVLLGMFLWMLCRVLKLGNWIKRLCVLSLCVILTFPLCFGAIRYLPPVFHHPIWFWGEWNEERVHSWDPWNSEKFIDMDEYLEAAGGRIFDSFANLLEHSPFALSVHAAEQGTELLDIAELPPNKIPVLTPEQGTDAFLVRSTIYKYYAQRLNLWGYPYEEQGFQLHVGYWIGHAHNIFLQYGTDFGIPVMLLFMTLLVWGSIELRKRFKTSGEAVYAGAWMYLLIPAIFGMFEYSWGVGSLSILMLFMAWRNVICNEEQAD